MYIGWAGTKGGCTHLARPSARASGAAGRRPRACRVHWAAAGQGATPPPPWGRVVPGPQGGVAVAWPAHPVPTLPTSLRLTRGLLPPAMRERGAAHRRAGKPAPERCCVRAGEASSPGSPRTHSSLAAGEGWGGALAIDSVTTPWCSDPALCTETGSPWPLSAGASMSLLLPLLCSAGTGPDRNRWLAMACSLSCVGCCVVVGLGCRRVGFFLLDKSLASETGWRVLGYVGVAVVERCARPRWLSPLACPRQVWRGAVNPHVMAERQYKIRGTCRWRPYLSHSVAHTRQRPSCR